MRGGNDRALAISATIINYVGEGYSFFYFFWGGGEGAFRSTSHNLGDLFSSLSNSFVDLDPSSPTSSLHLFSFSEAYVFIRTFFWKILKERERERGY